MSLQPNIGNLLYFKLLLFDLTESLKYLIKIHGLENQSLWAWPAKTQFLFFQIFYLIILKTAANLRYKFQVELRLLLVFDQYFRTLVRHCSVAENTEKQFSKSQFSCSKVKYRVTNKG